VTSTTEKLYPLRLAAKATGLTDEVVKITNVRYAVPEHYTSGTEYPTLAEAAEAAQSKVVEFNFNDSETGRPAQARAFVDLRATLHYKRGGSVDAVIERIEVVV
jgi:hypothetical protein